MRKEMIITLIAVLGITNIAQYLLSADNNSKPNYYQFEEVIVDKSFARYAAYTGDSLDGLKKSRYAKTLEIKGNTCVGMPPRLGGVGSYPVYCWRGDRLVSSSGMDE